MVKNQPITKCVTATQRMCFLFILFNLTSIYLVFVQIKPVSYDMGFDLCVDKKDIGYVYRNVKLLL